LGKLSEWAKEKSKSSGGRSCVTCAFLPDEALDEIAEMARMNRETGNAPSQRTLTEGLRAVYNYPYSASALQKHLNRCVQGGWSG
jgi:hypothetical protein